MSSLFLLIEKSDVTPERLNANPSLLLHKKHDESRPSFSSLSFLPLTFFPCSDPSQHTFMCGAVLEQGHYFQCSPNVTWMDEAPAGGSREVYMRANFRYADDDYIQWPQPGGSFHLAAILRSGQEDPLFDILFKVFIDPSDSLISTNSHFVSLCAGDLAAFDKVHSHLQSRTVNYLDCPDTQQDVESYKHVVRSRKGYADAFMIRLKGQPMTSAELRRCIAELQRFLLEWAAALDWDLVFRRRIQGLDPPASKADEHRMGTFTHEPSIVANCVKAGLPVFYIQEVKNLPHTRIDSLVALRKAKDHLTFDESRFKYPTIFKGKATDPRRLEEIYWNSRFVLHSANIFACNYNPPPPRQDAPRSLNSAQRNGDTHRGIQVASHPCMLPKLLAHNNTDKALDRSNKITATQRSSLSGSVQLKPVTSLHFPAILPSWLRAIDAINVKQFPTELPSDRGYAFVNPSVFFDAPKQTTKPAMIYRWLQLRTVMLFRVGPAVPINLTGPVSSRVWRRALQLEPSTFDSIRQDRSGSRSATEKQESLAFLESTIQAAGYGVAGLLQQPATWRGNVYESPAALDDVLMKEVIFEVSELNFRHELLALDRRLCTRSDPDSFDRHEQILDCLIPSPLARAFLVVEHHQSSRGLAHSDIRERVPQLNHLRNLMGTWETPFTAFDQLDVNTDTAHLHQMEEALYGFYVRQFFIIFGRPPVIPRSL